MKSIEITEEEKKEVKKLVFEALTFADSFNETKLKTFNLALDFLAIQIVKAKKNKNKNETKLLKEM